jgi:hypothetical protein
MMRAPPCVVPNPSRAIENKLRMNSVRQREPPHVLCQNILKWFGR